MTILSQNFDGIPVTFFNGESVVKLVEEYEGIQFQGPNSLCLHSNGAIFFTDSGPLGYTR